MHLHATTYASSPPKTMHLHATDRSEPLSSRRPAGCLDDYYLRGVIILRRNVFKYWREFKYKCKCH
jgi:hypothetical protein